MFWAGKWALSIIHHEIMGDAGVRVGKVIFEKLGSNEIIYFQGERIFS